MGCSGARVKQTYTKTNDKGETISLSSENLYGRGLSWFGISATEAAVKDQGLKIEGDSITFAENKGYGILESFWSKVTTANILKNPTFLEPCN